MKKLSNEEFIEKAKKKHGLLYDYELACYQNNRTKVKIICKIHGEFMQAPNHHLRGEGCKSCSMSKRGPGKKSHENFIKDACQVHDFKYAYLSTYRGAHEKMTIKCEIHGIFEQIANEHLKGKGCLKCGKENSANKRRKLMEEFIKQVVDKHGYKYDYSETIYHNTKEKINIICKKHGKFEQIAYEHLKGAGCPVCNESKGESKINQWLLNNEIIFERQYRFNKCKNKRKLPFDFYLPELNICIEYDGEFHFKNKFGIESLKYTQHNDHLKTEFCFENNIKLLRISFEQFDQISLILSEAISC